VSHNLVTIIEVAIKIKIISLDERFSSLNALIISILVILESNIVEIIDKSAILSLQFSAAILVSQSATPKWRLHIFYQTLRNLCSSIISTVLTFSQNI